MKIEIIGVLNSKEKIADQILSLHGLDENWLTADKTFFLNGSTMRNFQQGWDLLEKHKENKVWILTDNDLDGFSSAAVMYMWLKETYPKMELNYIVPEGKVHGILDPLMPSSEECDLFIIPDASSNEIEKHKKYSELYDILIIDHHSLESEAYFNPYAVIINPHHPECSYPNKTLSGVGVVYKFIETIDQINKIDNHSKYLDLVASGIVADVMSIKTYETKAIINIGLKNLTNPFIVAYLNSEGRLEDKTSLTPIGVSFYLAPLINSVIRIGSLELKQQLFQAMIGEIAAEPIIAEMKKIKGKQDRSKEPAVVRIVRELQKTGGDKNAVIVAYAPSSLSRSMTGLVAGQLAGMYQKPVLLGREQDGEFIGSGRSLSGSTVEKFREFLIESGLVNWASGHSSAFGLSLPIENINKFISHANFHLPIVERTYKVWKMEGDRGEIIKQLDQLSPHYGTNFPEPLLFDRVYIESNVDILGKNQNTIKINGVDLDYIRFKYKGEVPSKNKVLEVVGKANINRWNGMEVPQMIIEDWIEKELEL